MVCRPSVGFQVCIHTVPREATLSSVPLAEVLTSCRGATREGKSHKTWAAYTQKFRHSRVQRHDFVLLTLEAEPEEILVFA